MVVCLRRYIETTLIRSGSCRRHRHNRDRHQARGEQSKRRSAYVHLAESILVSGNGSGGFRKRWPGPLPSADFLALARIRVLTPVLG